jgi:hypothetical protein
VCALPDAWRSLPLSSLLPDDTFFTPVAINCAENFEDNTEGWFQPRSPAMQGPFEGLMGMCMQQSTPTKYHLSSSACTDDEAWPWTL